MRLALPDWGLRMKINKGATLIEICVVMAVIFVVTGILFVAIRSAVHSAKSTQSLENLSQLGKAQFLYAADYNDSLPPYSTIDDLPKPLTSDTDSVFGAWAWKHVTEKYVGDERVYFSPIDPWAGDESGRALYNPTIRHITSYDHSIPAAVYVIKQRKLYQIQEPANTIWMHEMQRATERSSNGMMYPVPPDNKSFGNLYFDGHVKRVAWHPHGVETN